MAHQGLFEPDFGPLNFFVLEFGPLAKKVGHPCYTVYISLYYVLHAWPINFYNTIQNKASYATGIDQEVKFHEIKIHFLIWSTLNLFMRLNLFINIWQCQPGGRHFDHEIKTPKSIISNFDLMIDLVDATGIIRSKLKIKHY